MIASGEVFFQHGGNEAVLKPQEQFLNRNVRVLAAGLDRAYVAVEPPVPQEGQQASVWMFRGDSEEPVECPEFSAVEGRIRQIAIGEKHLLVLNSEGAVLSLGPKHHGPVGHGGARVVESFAEVPALRGKKMKLVAAGPHYSVAVAEDGDVYSWGQAFQGETGLFSCVEAVPRFAPAITPFRVVEVSCGHGHVLARTEARQCITWGENTCGQLGLGHRSKPTYKPQLLEIPSEVETVSAGWAHSIAVGTDGRAYSWGLNSHGQLGLGDTKTRMAPELVSALVDVHQVTRAESARTFTVLRTEARRALLCGQVPSGVKVQVDEEKPPMQAKSSLLRESRSASKDETPPPASTSLLVPAPLSLAARPGAPGGVSMSELEQVIAFDRGIVAFAPSTVHRVSPNLAPTSGGTAVRALVSGLPFEVPGDAEPVQDTIPAMVRLQSQAHGLDVVLEGRIVDVDTAEFISPNVCELPFGLEAAQARTNLAVNLSVSVDGGMTWTQERHSAGGGGGAEGEAIRPVIVASNVADQHHSGAPSRTDPTLDLNLMPKPTPVDDQPGGPAALWISPWPQGGPTHVEPGCSPLEGGTELLLHVDLPSQLPDAALTVKFVCKPLESIEDPELQDQADVLAKLEPVEMPVKAWLDAGGRGVRCTTPALELQDVRLYTYTLELSLDGIVYLERTLPFSIFDLHVTSLEPPLGPLREPCEVRIKCDGLVGSDVHRVRLHFPEDLSWAPRVLPAAIDHTSGEIYFTMPELSAEVRERVDAERAARAAQAEADAAAKAAAAEAAAAKASEGNEGGEEAAPEEGEGEGGAEEAQETPLDPEGGLGGLEVVVELSLNGQNFTEDGIRFAYHPEFEPGAAEMIAPPEGVTIEPPKEDPKAKGKKKDSIEEKPVEIVVLPGAKLGVELKRGATPSAFAVVRAELATKAGDEELQVLKTVDIPATLESVQPPPPSPPPEDPKAKKDATPPPPPEELPPRDMLVALAPGVRTDELPEGAVVFLRAFQVSLNGKNFATCPEVALPMRLEPLKAEEN